MSGLPTPPPLDDTEYEHYVESSLPEPSTNAAAVLDEMKCPTKVPYERRMGDTELSYFLPSRQTGVNDMYLHLGFHAPERLVRRPRVRTVYAILRLRHPMLSARVEMHDYDDVRFVYDAPSSVEDVLDDAEANLEYRHQSKDELIDTYLNGPRTLSNTRLSYLILSQPTDSLLPTPPRTPSPSNSGSDVQQLHDAEDVVPGEHSYELLICAMHFLGDGMALHQFANDFFGLLGSEKDDAELEAVLEAEWRSRWENDAPETSVLPSCLEDHLPVSSSRFRRVAASIDFQLSQASQTGGQNFPRRKHPDRHTIVPTVSFPEDRTKAMLRKCKEHGVSISAALFAVCSVAWARAGSSARGDLPTMMYSALNLRPYFSKAKEQAQERALQESYWFLAIGYFNVILPSFLPKEGQEKTFWHRARMAKAQSARAAKSKMVVSRTHEMARERGERARIWAREDDEKERGTWVPPKPSASPAPPSIKDILPARTPGPSSALLGLSLLGNLDGMYSHASFPALKLHTLTTGSRQRHGAMLLFGYTFKGRLWVSLGYDENGFEEGVVERFWKEVGNCVEEYLG
ncbi:hypothetical protein WOLCODRAFT_135419 [Wolfiporia cocos MD-104 SS10]|uniref:Alcohol acetyltransferase n=1 Tax=Wolfiporia cocos (strain MD-104) TaxID=742152 RepID=A0A2H3JDD5_WOLCO|nr:hypothetical protein WOLCODRAFT_135419 [Wolfiporia cocos MD-104 SS10]